MAIFLCNLEMGMLFEIERTGLNSTQLARKYQMRGIFDVMEFRNARGGSGSGAF